MPQPFSCSSCALPVIPATQVEDSLFLSQEPDLTFSRIRRALIVALPSQAVSEILPLKAWRPYAGLNHLLPDIWAYIGDLLRLYGSWLRAESLFATARRERALRDLALLLGHIPRPAVGARGEVAALIARGDAVSLGDTSICISSSTSPPPTFELNSEGRARGSFSEFLLRPLRKKPATRFGERSVLLDVSSASPVRGTPVLFVWPEELVKRKATEIPNVRFSKEGDAQQYIEMEVADPPSWPSNVQGETVAVLSPSQRAYARTELFLSTDNVLQSISAMNDSEIEGAASVLGFVPDGHNGFKNYSIEAQNFSPADRTRCTLYLDGVYRAISTGDTVIVQHGSNLSAHLVLRTVEIPVTIKLDEDGTPGPSVPVTRLTLLPEVDPNVAKFSTTNRLIIHYNLHDIGRLTRVALTELTKDDILNKPLERIGDLRREFPSRVG